MYEFVLQIRIYEFVLTYDLQTQQKKLQRVKKRASPLSPGTPECVHLVQKMLRHMPYDLRHGLARFHVCTRTIRTPSKIQDLYELFPCHSQPLWGTQSWRRNHLGTSFAYQELEIIPFSTRATYHT
jgi:hypothetical protein